MPAIHPIPAISYRAEAAVPADVSRFIAPPYDVLDEKSKAALLARSERNIVAVDLPHLPAKTVGPDATYDAAGQTFRQWLADGTLERSSEPAMFVYQQTYTVAGVTHRRRGLIANVTIQPFGPGPRGQGGIHPHEQTFSGPKEDRLKLMRATKAQLSPIFGLYSDPGNHVGPMLAQVIDAGPPAMTATTTGDGVRHEAWRVTDRESQIHFSATLSPKDIFIADGHHRYNTALNYKRELTEQVGSLHPRHPANFCLFVLISMQDPGMIVLPTHRVLGNMGRFSFDALTEAARGRMRITPFARRPGNGHGVGVAALAELEAALPAAGPHAMGLYVPANAAAPLAIATFHDADPLASTHEKMSPAWRQLDVALVQHVLVEQVCQPHLCGKDEQVTWKFPHALEQFAADANTPGYQLGVLVQPTPLEAVRLVSEAGELMPQKSTFFYPKLATGMVINPLD